MKSMKIVSSSVHDWMGLKRVFSPCSLLQKLINISSEVLNIHIIPTQSRHFQTSYTKQVSGAPSNLLT